MNGDSILALIMLVAALGSVFIGTTYLLIKVLVRAYQSYRRGDRWEW